MKRRKSLLLLWIFVVVVGASGLVYLGARLLLVHRANALRDRGLAAAAAGDDATATDLLLQYIHRRPNEVSLEPETIKSYIHSRQRVPMTTGQQYIDTLAVLKLLLQSEPGNTEDQRYLLELYVKGERAPEAIDVADAILHKLPKDAETLKLKTQALIQQRKYQDAVEPAERWTAAAPEDLDAYITRLDVYTHVGRPPQSILDDATALRTSHPGDAKFEVLQGIAYARSASAPGLTNNEADKVRATAILWFQTAAKHPDLSGAIAGMLVDQFDGLAEYPQALAVLQDRVTHGAADLRDALAGRYWELGRWKDLADTLNDLKPTDPKADSTLLAFKSIALARIGQGQNAAACRTALASNKTRPDARAWTALLRQIMDGAVIDEKLFIVDCRAAQSVDSQNPYLLYFLGDAEVRLGELDLAVSAFGRSAQTDAHWDLPAIRLVETLLAKGEFDQASQVANLLASRNQHDPAAWITLFEARAACIENGQGGQADELLSDIKQMEAKLPSENRTLPTIEVAILASEGKKDQAKQAAHEAMAKTPPPAEQVYRIFAILSRQYSLGLETACFDGWEHAHGISPSLAYMEAIDKASGGHTQDGLTLYDKLAQQSQKSNDMDWRLNRTRYVDATADLTDFRATAAAKSAWTSLRDAFPDSLPVQQACINGRVVHGDWQFMQPVIDHLHAITGDNGLTWQLAQDRLLVESPRKEQKEQEEEDYEKGSIGLTSLIERFPQLSEPHVLLAEALVHMKRLDGAVQHLTVATKLDPTSVQISLQLIRLLQSLGESDRAQAELDRVIGLGLTLNPQQRKDVAVLLAQLGKTDRAIALLQPSGRYASAATRPTDDADQQLLLATLYRQNHQLDAAEAIAHNLLQHPTLPIVQFAASLFFADGRAEQAEQALQLLDGLNLPPGAKEMTRGDYYYRAGDVADAVKYFASATALVPTDPVAWRSLMICQMLLGKTNDAAATMDKAIQALPNDKSLVAVKKQMPNLINAALYPSLRPLALSWMENPPISDSPVDPAVELMGVVVQERGAKPPVNFDRLAGRLQQIVQRSPDYLPAQLQLIQCYLDAGKPLEALSVAQRAMAAFPNDPQPAQAAVEICNISGRWPEMESAAESWIGRSPNMAEAADTSAAMAESHMGNYSAALNRLQPYLVSAKADMDRHVPLLSAYAVASIGNGNADSAAEILWPLAQKSSASREQWIQIAANLLPAAQAVQWLDRVSSIIPSDVLLERCAVADAYDVLGRRVNDPQPIAKSFDLYQEIVKDPKANAVVFLSAGCEAERANKVDQAEAFYRRAIALDPMTWVAQNNLAMLIVNHGGDLKEALAAAESAVNAQPDSAEILDTLAEVQAKAGDLATAAATMQKAINLQKNNLMWQVRFARYELDSNNVPAASKAIATIDANFPDLSGQAQELQQQVADIKKQIHGKGT